MRVDKFLWCVRLAKTRSMAAKLCNEGNVVLNHEVIKAAMNVSLSDIISVKHNPIWRDYRILEIPKSRMSAKQVPDFLREITDPDILKQYEDIQKANRMNQHLGIKGRPTKKNRRNINKFKGAS